MARGHAHVTLVGNLGGEPDMRYTSGGSAVTNFSLAVNRKRRTRDGDYEDAVDWYRVAVWGKQAETAAELLDKGARVMVQGELRIEPFTDREGKQRQSVEVNAQSFLVLSSRDDGRERGRSGAGRERSDDDELDDVPY